jgi:single-stranded-DNA-specific exonuclease
MTEGEAEMRDSARHHILKWLSPADWAVAYDAHPEEQQDVLSSVLTSRGLDTPIERDAFLHVSLDDIPDPFLFLDMEKACVIVDGVLRMESPRILIFGDYDADGLTSSALLARWFKSRECEAEILIPDRFDDGFGLSVALAEEIILHNPHLVITVDTGTSSPDAIKFLRQHGIKVIVTDHHLPDELFARGEVPIINPSIPDESYPFKELSGAGVAYLMTLALDRFLGEISTIRPALTVIASVGTVADVVPLLGVNRAIVRAGLEAFDEHAPEGLKALYKYTSSSRRGGTLMSRDFAFSIGPRLNAAGRVGDVRLALDLLLEDDPERVVFLALELHELNEERRQVEQEVFQDAFHDVMKRQGDEPLSIAIARGKGWHGGVLGIVSARLAERLRVPAITLTEEDGMLTGSARTFGRINLIEGITYAGTFLETFGGHEGAAGLSLKAENFDQFREAMVHYIESIPIKKRHVPILADTTLEGHAIDAKLVESFNVLEPTGYGFEQPLFIIPSMMIEEITRVGDGKHLRLKVRSQDDVKSAFDTILFNRGDDEPFYSVGDEIDLIGTPEFNFWRDRRSIQLRCTDLRPSYSSELDNRLQHAFPEFLRQLPDPHLTEAFNRHGLMSINREDVVALWQLVSSIAGRECVPIAFSPSRLAWLLTHRYNVDAGALAVLFILAIFAEVGLGELVADEGGGFIFRLLEIGEEKLVLTEAPLWVKLDAQGVLVT